MPQAFKKRDVTRSWRSRTCRSRKHYLLLYQVYFKLLLLALGCECVGMRARASTQASVCVKLTPGNLKQHLQIIVST